MEKNAKPAQADRKALVVRHNELIESRHTLSLQERRFMLWIVSQIKKDDEDFKVYRISVTDFIAFSGLEKSDLYYHRIVEMAKSLVQRSLGIKNKEDKGFKVFPWFYLIEYKWGEGAIEVQLHPKLKPYLLQLKEQYTAITLEYALLLRSSYSHRIYDLLKQYQDIGKRIILLSVLREMLEIDNKYQKYKDFRVWILETSKKEINEKTDISFDFNPIKKGRKVDAIHFTITTKTPAVTLDNREEMDPKARRIFQKLLRLGVKDKTARDLVADYDNERLNWHISEYESRQKEGKTEGVGWLVKGVQEDYRPQISIFEREEEKKRKNAKQKRAKKEALSAEIDQIMKECNAQNRKMRMDLVQGMSEAERAEIDREFKEKHKNLRGILDKFETEGLENTVARGLYLDIVREKYPDCGMSYKEYAESKGVKRELLKTL